MWDSDAEVSGRPKLVGESKLVGEPKLVGESDTQSLKPPRVSIVSKLPLSTAFI